MEALKSGDGVTLAKQTGARNKTVQEYLHSLRMISGGCGPNLDERLSENR